MAYRIRRSALLVACLVAFMALVMALLALSPPVQADDDDDDDGFVCDDPLGCVTYGPGEPLRLGAALVVEGPLSFLGIDSRRGVELALDFRGTVLGRTVEVRVEDSGCSPSGGELAADALVADPTVAAVVGTSCSGRR